MKVQFCRWVTNGMLIIFRIMTAIKSPSAFAIFAMNVTGFIRRFILTHHQYVRLQSFFSETGGLPHKLLYYFSLVLRQHGRNSVAFCRKCKKGKIILLNKYARVNGIIYR